MDYISEISPAMAVRFEEIYFYEKSKWRSSITKIAGWFCFSYVNVVRMYYSAPPMTLLRRFIELIWRVYRGYLAKDYYWVKDLTSWRAKVVFPVPEKPLIRIPFNGPKPFFMY